LYIIFLLVCNLVIPVLLYYLIQSNTSLDQRTDIGISSAALGISSCFDAPFRLYKLVRFRKRFGPLNDDVWWHMDFTMHTYTFALLIFAFPLAVAPATTPIIIDFFLVATAMLVAPFGIVALYTLTKCRLPVWASSDAPGTVVKPAAFYWAEDVAAVDFRCGRPYRTEINERWNASPPFRTLMNELTWFTVFATAFYFGITAAVAWGSPLNFAFGYTLGQFFIWAAVSAAITTAIVKRGLRRERAWWAARAKEQQMGEVPR